MIDRVAESIGKPLVEVPVGFKWFVPGLMDGSFGFGGEESAGASFLRRDGSTWTTDKDGLLLALLASEILGATGRTPSQHYAELVARHGDPAYARIDAPADREQKAKLAALSPDDVAATTLAGEEITGKLTEAPGNGAKIGGLKVTTESAWFAARPRHRGRLQDLRGVVPRSRPPRPGAGRGAGGRQRGLALSPCSISRDCSPREGCGTVTGPASIGPRPASPCERASVLSACSICPRRNLTAVTASSRTSAWPSPSSSTAPRPSQPITRPSSQLPATRHAHLGTGVLGAS